MKIYVGWDSREDIAYQVCEHSIKRRDPSAEVIPLKQNDMRAQGIYTREKDKLATTEFTFTRFFVPYLNDFKGWAVFCDCDFLWKSMVLWNCEHPKNKLLTPEFLNDQTPKFLHRFTWLENSEIGSLPHNYNWLVGWYREPEDGSPKILHYTEGGPWFDGYRDCEYSDDWKKEAINLFSA